MSKNFAGVGAEKIGFNVMIFYMQVKQNTLLYQ